MTMFWLVAILLSFQQPEPVSLVLAGAGLLLFGSIRRRRG